MPRIQGLDDSVTFNADIAVKPGAPVYLFNITVAWTGATAGQAIVLRNGSDNTAPYRVPIVLSAATGTLQLSWSNGKHFPLGLFIDVQGAGQIQGEITYK